jgi:Protein of unknown function (DUF4235)
MTVAKVLYWPIGIAVGVLGSRLAGAAFERTWKLAAREGDPPKPTDQGHGFFEVVAAGVVKGAVFGGVKALADHAGAAGYARATGVWPGAKADDKLGGRTGSRPARRSRT